MAHHAHHTPSSSKDKQLKVGHWAKDVVDWIELLLPSHEAPSTLHHHWHCQGFYSESHHPVIEIVKHTISPLSVAMFIWFAGKKCSTKHNHKSFICVIITRQVRAICDQTRAPGTAHVIL